MPPLLSISHMRTSEAQTMASGVSAATLVERAGTAVAAEVLQRYPHVTRVLVCVGPGNNGADGIVVACALHRAGVAVRILCWNRSPDEWVAQAQALQIPIDTTSLVDALRTLCAPHDLVVDALLGIGANRPVRDDLAVIVQAINARPNGVPCVAVDVPTGCVGDGEIAPALLVHADLTVATGPRKLGTCFMPALAASGHCVSVDIGLLHSDTSCVEVTIPHVAPWLPPRPLDAYKGTFGTLCVWAGSAAYPGAAVLASSAALRSGAGIVSLATTPALVPLVWRMPELTITLLDQQPLTALSDTRYSAFVVGPGLGRSPDVEALLTTWLNPLHIGTRPVVLDADALTLLSRAPQWHQQLPPRQAVLTPHRGELKRLLGSDIPAVSPCTLAQMLAQRWQQVLVMKGSTTVIASPTGECVVWPHPNPVLATGGSGDVLAGIIGALLAQGVACFRAAVLGVVIQGVAAQRLRRSIGDTGVLPSDVIAHLPETIAHIRDCIVNEGANADL